VPASLTLSQRLTGPDGVPTTVARAGAVALACAAAALGFAAGPDGQGGEQARHSQRGGAIAISRLAGELPIASPEPRPELRSAAALPALRGRPARRTRQAAPVSAPAPAPRPAPAPTPEPAAAMPKPAVETPAPPPAAAPAPKPQPAPRSAPAPKPQPAPRSTPAPTFDSSG
jgi:outer membrane biosynthesis protein TonB